ncbi:GNAT family N-acetyltransferase [Pseudoduganella namucuonensis]|uniref:Ribosomal protein S18 acetylase RimI n=1 Tax=Pseudoduganella namucuonensis TaxID=1035707 RepID=A0A1I7IY80_9BURK|nr:GNAT family N-acetyltransferase [Pseudoduganella namucuonensis]SFU77832.1 Ribosomal protein S18 acetylase RimI [Pseudoduganella namucuonensis]
MMTYKTAPSIELRPATQADQAFLQRLYLSTRGAESRLHGCDPSTEAMLLNLQFKAQQTDFQLHYPHAEVTVIVERDSPIGRLYVDYRTDEVRLVDLSLLPEYRGRGIGKGLLRGLQAHGQRLDLPVRLQVLLGNPAQRLCQRCDFVMQGLDGLYATMEWCPS